MNKSDECFEVPTASGVFTRGFGAGWLKKTNQNVGWGSELQLFYGEIGLEFRSYRLKRFK